MEKAPTITRDMIERMACILARMNGEDPYERCYDGEDYVNWMDYAEEAQDILTEVFGG